MSAQGEEQAPLGRGARSIIDAARPHERLSDVRKDRLRGRVMAAVGAGAAVGLAAGAAQAAEIAGTGASLGAGAVKTVGLSLFAKIGIGVAIATVGAGGVLWSRAQQDTSRPTAAVTVTPSESALASNAPGKPAQQASSANAAAPDTAGSTSSDGTFRPADSAPRASSPAPDARPQATAEATADAVDSLQEEAKLLAAAHAELSRGNPTAALAILDQHAAKFPRGTLAPERRATRAMALCKAGRTDEGRRELAVLYGDSSKSPMAQKIDRACGK